jgi:hypothetical protein
MTDPNDLLATTRELVKCAEDYEWTERCYNLDAARVASDRARLIAAIFAWQAAASQSLGR